MAVARLALTSFADGEVRLSDEVELYQRTYTTLLRSSGETALRVLEPSHMAMGSALHPLAASEELDLGAFLYAVQRLPDGIAGAELVVMGQAVEALTAAGIPVDSWEEAEAPARRRRWYDSGTGHARGAARECLGRRRPPPDARRVPDRVEQDPRAHARRGLARRAALPRRPARRVRARARRQRRRLGAPAQIAWGAAFGERMRQVAEERLSLRVRMLGGTNTGYARLTRRWWAPVSAELVVEGLTERPLYFVSSNSHSLVNIVTGIAQRARARADRVRRATARGRHPAPGAERPSASGREPGLVGELPVLRRPSVLQRRRAGGRGRAPRARAAAGRHPPAEHDRVARARPGHLARRRSTPRRSIRGSARSIPTRSPRAAR